MTVKIPRRRLVDAVSEAAVGPFVRLGATFGRMIVAGGTVAALSVRDVEAESKEAWSVVLPSRLLAQACKSLPEGDVELSFEGAALRIACGSHRAEILPSGRLPAAPAVPVQAWRQLAPEEGRRLAWAVRTAAAAALCDDTRPAHSGVRLEEGFAVGTDGARMHVAAALDVGRAATIPIASAKLLAEAVDAPEQPKPKKPKKGEVLPPPPAAPAVRLALGQHSIAAELDGRRVFVRLAPEGFYEWRRVADVVQGSPRRILVPRDELVGVVRSTPGAELELRARPGGLDIRYEVRDEDAGGRRVGSGELVVAGDALDAGEAEIKVSARFLRDALVGCGPEVELSVEKGQPLRFRSRHELGELRGLVMFSR